MTNALLIAERLIRARTEGSRVPLDMCLPASAAQAYEIQNKVIATLGPIGGWKVGSTPNNEPSCAPLPVSGLIPSGSVLGQDYRLRGIELEIALRVGKSLAAADVEGSDQQLASAFDAVFPVLEIVETRLATLEGAAPLVKLADSLVHGAVIVGRQSDVKPADIDLSKIEAELDVDGTAIVKSVGGNPAGTLWPMIRWLIRHSSARGLPLQPGQIIITGSCTGLEFVGPSAVVQGKLSGYGNVGVTFSA